MGPPGQLAHGKRSRHFQPPTYPFVADHLLTILLVMRQRTTQSALSRTVFAACYLEQMTTQAKGGTHFSQVRNISAWRKESESPCLARPSIGYTSCWMAIEAAMCASPTHPLSLEQEKNFGRTSGSCYAPPSNPPWPS